MSNTHTFKKIYDSETTYKIGYFVNGNFQKYVNENKPSYIKYASENIVEIVPYVAPEPVALGELRRQVVLKIFENERKELEQGILFKGNNIATSDKSREMILGGARKAEKDPLYTAEAVTVDGQLILLSNEQLKELSEALDDMGDTVHKKAIADFKTASTASREQLDNYLATGEFE